MQPQDIEHSIKALKSLNDKASISLLIDGNYIGFQEYEMRVVDGATLIRSINSKGQCFGVFDVRSVAGVIDSNYDNRQL